MPKTSVRNKAKNGGLKNILSLLLKQIESFSLFLSLPRSAQEMAKGNGQSQIKKITF